MKKEKLNELLQLYILDELNETEKAELERYLENSESARKELGSLQNLFKTVHDNKPESIVDDILITSRQNVLRQIRIEESRESKFSIFINTLKHFSLSGYRLAGSTVFAAAFGIILGFLIFGGGDIPGNENLPNQPVNIDNILNGSSNLSNIRFDTDPASGNINISFDAVNTLTYNGSMDDEVVKYLLAAALLKNNNPGSRLRTVNTIVEQTAAAERPDPEIKKALIKSLKSDSNPAVRKSALQALKNYQYDNEIRDAVLYVLGNDSNSGLRVDAINTLAGFKIEGISIDDKIKNELTNRINNEENGFIKYRAAALLEGEE